jgi:hypothetical protein
MGALPVVAVAAITEVNSRLVALGTPIFVGPVLHPQLPCFDQQCNTSSTAELCAVDENASRGYKHICIPELGRPYCLSVAR